MIGHVAPHRWADAFAGKLDASERAAMDSHAKSCARCATARARIARASDTFPTLRSSAPPEIAWDEVRARVHWSVSTERRSKVTLGPRIPRRALVAVLGAAGLVAAGFALVPMLRGSASTEVASAPPAPATRPVARPVVAAPTPVIGAVSRIAGEVMLDGIRAADLDVLFGRAIGAGTLLATGDGRIDIQFGDDSALSLGPRSSLELRRFDGQAIELAVEGTVDVVVAPRATGQMFTVVAGDRTIEVRGTQFRVVHDRARGATDVECRHGLVQVRSSAPGHPPVAVGAGQALDGDRAIALAPEQLAELVQATPVTTPIWASVSQLAQQTAALDIATSAQRDVRVDGVELGAAPLRVRVMPGRHTIDAADRGGRFHRVGWVDVGSGSGESSRFEVPAATAPAPTGGVSARSRELERGIAKVRARLDVCTRPLAKQGISDLAIDIELAVDAQGAVGYLNPQNSDFGGATQSCVVDVLRDVRFGPGPAATWHQHIAL